jgi:Oxidoreductase molybdopterin binding domain
VRRPTAEELRVGPFAPGAFPSRLHDERLATILGIALGVAFTACFVTGLISHLLQHPLHVGFLSWPSRPRDLYRWTQGVHVATGIASVPLLLAKLWTVYPRLFTWPPFRDVAHVVERLSLVPLVAGSVFLLATGIANDARWYIVPSDFTRTHFWTAWITVGALIVHVGAKWATAASALSHAEPEPPGEGLNRRGFLVAVAAGTGLITVTTLGETLRPLKALDVLGPRRPDIGPQGFPVNKSAAGAGVTMLARDAGYRLTVDGDVGRPLSLSLAELRALPQHEAHLPIACVEGWSAGVRWRGVRMRDVLALAEATPGDHHVTVHSLQRHGLYRSSTLNPAHASDPDTMLALEANGAPLHIDHGFPCRLIAPSLPGVLQTKWVNRVHVA